MSWIAKASGEDHPLIDLHTHSNRSDGTDTPSALVYKAKAAGVSVLALTDHDTASGWRDASSAAAETGIQIVRGIELSVEDRGQGLHLLAYEPDPADPALSEMLIRSVAERDRRIPALVEKIAPHVPALRLADVLAIAGNAIPGRPHVADALVRCGAVADRSAAFALYLSPGCPTYVETWSPPIEEAIHVVHRAGGATVLAHPWRRSSSVPRERFLELKGAGLNGIEVDHQEHDVKAREALGEIARDLELVVTGSSDYHGTRKQNHDLGCNTTARDQYDKLASSWS